MKGPNESKDVKQKNKNVDMQFKQMLMKIKIKIFLLTHLHNRSSPILFLWDLDWCKTADDKKTLKDKND